MSGDDQIIWPDAFHPNHCPVFVSNEIDSPAKPAHVWAWLVRATFWPQWYPNSASVVITQGLPPDLTATSKFRWTTFGVRLDTEVEEFVPGERIAWRARAFGVDAYHAWLLRPTSTGGCHILTEETQKGFLARAGNLLMPYRMSKFHQIWLEQLSAKAQTSLPPLC